MLFSMVANQIGKEEQNALIMARLMKLLENIKVPKQDEEHVRYWIFMVLVFQKVRVSHLQASKFEGIFGIFSGTFCLCAVG